eukprot:TRINITY_DN3091_c1_g1_i2.p2 TRINITY_DN3091_c1_g1~~TRINITY_DN3091_c1_g1_i2.p2  ORF type:complete len:173 (-),score=2.59 TRINITY_DN3091_c1_g1_i2:5-523(-)
MKYSLKSNFHQFRIFYLVQVIPRNSNQRKYTVYRYSKTDSGNMASEPVDIWSSMLDQMGIVDNVKSSSEDISSANDSQGQIQRDPFSSSIQIYHQVQLWIYTFYIFSCTYPYSPQPQPQTLAVVTPQPVLTVVIMVQTNPNVNKEVVVGNLLNNPIQTIYLGVTLKKILKKQ